MVDVGLVHPEEKVDGASAPSSTGRALRYVVYALCGYIAVFFGGRAVLNERAPQQPSSSAMASVTPPPGEEQVVVVFIGSPTCAASRSPALKRALRLAYAMLESEAQLAGASLYRIGVAPSMSVSRGVDYLDGMGEFDEIVVGGGIHSLGVLKYVAEGYPGPDATPQLLVLQRVTSDGGWGVEEESLSRRLVGVDGILEWVEGDPEENTQSPVSGPDTSRIEKLPTH